MSIDKIGIEELKELSKNCKSYNGYSFVTGADKVKWWKNSDHEIIFYKITDNMKVISIIAGYEFGENDFFIKEAGRIKDIKFHIMKMIFEILKKKYGSLYFLAADDKLESYYISLGSELYKDHIIKY